jgi:hypothetical protein
MGDGDRFLKLRTPTHPRFLAKHQPLFFSTMDQREHAPLQRHAAEASLDQREHAPLQRHTAEASWATSPTAQPVRKRFWQAMVQGLISRNRVPPHFASRATSTSTEIPTFMERVGSISVGSLGA